MAGGAAKYVCKTWISCQLVVEPELTQEIEIQILWKRLWLKPLGSHLGEQEQPQNAQLSTAVHPAGVLNIRHVEKTVDGGFAKSTRKIMGATYVEK